MDADKTLYSHIGKGLGQELSDLISLLSTHLVVVVVLLLILLVGSTSSKNPKAPSFQLRSG